MIREDKEPESMEEAVQLRSRIIEEKQKVQARLTDLVVTGRVDDDEYARIMAKRKQAIHELHAAENRLRKVKLWIGQKFAAKPKETVEWEGTVAMAKDAFTDLWAYIIFLENKIKTLEAENTQLRETRI
jgi:hypothetical protein